MLVQEGIREEQRCYFDDEAAELACTVCAVLFQHWLKHVLKVIIKQGFLSSGPLFFDLTALIFLKSEN